MQHPNFIPNAHAGSRHETAVLLVGTAREFGIDQHAIKSVQGGYRITDELATVLYHESAKAEPKAPKKAKAKAKKTSGNRAAKTGTEQE